MAVRNFDNFLVDFNGHILQEPKRSPDGSVVLDLDNKPILVSLALKDLVAKAVGEKQRGDENLTFLQQADRAKLARKIAAGGNMELTLEEMLLIKETVAKASYNTTLVVEHVAKALEAEVPN